jgi:hypothetical protein
VTWFDDGNGWRDESTEGPYDTLVTKYPWSIFRGLPWERESDLFLLTNEETGEKLTFPSIESAKAHADEEMGE